MDYTVTYRIGSSRNANTPRQILCTYVYTYTRVPPGCDHAPNCAILRHFFSFSSTPSPFLPSIRLRYLFFFDGVTTAEKSKQLDFPNFFSFSESPLSLADASDLFFSFSDRPKLRYIIYYIFSKARSFRNFFKIGY